MIIDYNPVLDENHAIFWCRFPQAEPENEYHLPPVSEVTLEALPGWSRDVSTCDHHGETSHFSEVTS